MHPIFDPLIGFGLDHFGVPKDGVHPEWWCRALDQFFERWKTQWLNHMIAADEAGAGLMQEWASPGTSADEVLGWFDDTICAAPRGLLNPEIDFVAVFLVDVRAEEIETTPDGETVTVPEERLFARWEGMRRDWWRVGRDQIAAAIPVEHQSLSLVVNAMSRIIVTEP